MPDNKDSPEIMESQKMSYIFSSQPTAEPTGHEGAAETVPAQSAASVSAEKVPDPVPLQKHELSEQSENPQSSCVFPSQPAAKPAEFEAAASESAPPREPEMPMPPEPARFQASPAESYTPDAKSPAPERQPGKMSWPIIGGIAVFTLVVGVLIGSGLLRQNIVPVSSPAIDSPSPGAEFSVDAVQNNPASSTPSAGPQQLTQEQQVMLDTLTQKIPAVLPELAKNVTENDKVFLAAAQTAFYTNPVFDDSSLTVTLLLPDPRTSSLAKLGVEPYTPHSGHSAAQTYIRDGYAKLCRMEGITDWLEYSMKFYFQEIGDEKTLEWNTFPVSSALWEYSRVFAPHLDQYMADLGFYDAAIEVLMPVSGTWRNNADLDSDNMRQYFADFANALEFEGIEFNGKTVVSQEVIEKALRERMAEVWMCDSVSVYTNTFRVPQLKMRSVSAGSLFSKVLDGLRAQYDSGSLTMPSTYAELETVFLSTCQKMSEGLLESTAAKDRELVMDQDYQFDWETLGNEGIAACPSLVEDIRRLLFSYDFDLRFLAPYEMTPR